MLGDKVLINRAAYEVRFPYSDVLLLEHGGPYRSDMILEAAVDISKIRVYRAKRGHGSLA